MRAGLVGGTAVKARRVFVDDAVHCGEPASPGIGSPRLWHRRLRERTWDMVAEYYTAKGRNGQGAFRGLANCTSTRGCWIGGVGLDGAFTG